MDGPSALLRIQFKFFLYSIGTKNWDRSIYTHSNLDITNKSIGPFLFIISNNFLYPMYVICILHCKSSKWELGFVDYIAKLTKSSFVISRFECIWKKDLRKVHARPSVDIHALFGCKNSKNRSLCLSLSQYRYRMKIFYYLLRLVKFMR